MTPKFQKKGRSGPQQCQHLRRSLRHPSSHNGCFALERLPKGLRQQGKVEKQNIEWWNTFRVQRRMRDHYKELGS